MLGLSHFGFLFSNMITIIHTLTTLFRNETCKGKWSFFNKPENTLGSQTILRHDLLCSRTVCGGSVYF